MTAAESPAPYAPAEPLALVVAGTSRVVAYVCGAAGCCDIYRVHAIPGLDSAEALARRHCDRRCATCGHLRDTARDSCRPCDDRREREHEAATLAAAAQTPYEDWRGGMLYSPHVEAYVDCWDDLVERCERVGRDVPAYAWMCAEERPSLDAAELVERVEEAAGSADSGREVVGSAHAVKLQEALDQWCAEVSSWYVPDYTRAVLAPVTP